VRCTQNSEDHTDVGSAQDELGKRDGSRRPDHETEIRRAHIARFDLQNVDAHADRGEPAALVAVFAESRTVPLSVVAASVRH